MQKASSADEGHVILNKELHRMATRSSAREWSFVQHDNVSQRRVTSYRPCHSERSEESQRITTRYYIGQTHHGQAHEPARRFLMQGKHRAYNLWEDGVCKVSLATTDYNEYSVRCFATLNMTMII